MCRTEKKRVESRRNRFEQSKRNSIFKTSIMDFSIWTYLLKHFLLEIESFSVLASTSLTFNFSISIPHALIGWNSIKKILRVN